ncbi:hypothetical protein BZG29_16815 [Janthinobacterium sp. LM6]|uniref:hypothetical protein n=1 Tax=Janthinobacterium sp. LM6 TaxID=1938606 RepID=UPI000983A18F|nr:hypothetical protein [Janthinobacterium sp. LM6]AQR69800.1 hypothetical protein BZG29_16815 [Janthinobacterium sp. LM6]
MPQIQLFYPRKEAVDLALLLAVCDELSQEWKEHALGVEPMPVYGDNKSLAERLRINPHYACSFDVACRLLGSQRNTRQTSRALFDHVDNSQWFERIKAPHGLGGRNVDCVEFTAPCLAYWHGLPDGVRAQLALQAQQLICADVELGTGKDVAVVTMQRSDPQAIAALASTVEVPAGGALDRRQLLQLLVADIGQTPFQPRYRRHNIGAPVTGWDQRLLAYFWPHRTVGYAGTAQRTKPLMAAAAQLALCLEDGRDWDGQQQGEAVDLAKAIFSWGGVPQKHGTVTPANVAAVFRAALAADGKAAALMNSGWTKVAAFATAHRDHARAAGCAQVIWDSRVATSLISRLDHLLSANGQSAPGSLFPGIGTVAGRGGSRPRPLRLRWPDGYRKWSAQVAGSALVRDICGLLNAGNHPAMPLPEGGTGPWTMRGVEMVLFMDGY